MNAAELKQKLEEEFVGKNHSTKFVNDFRDRVEELLDVDNIELSLKNKTFTLYLDPAKEGRKFRSLDNVGKIVAHEKDHVVSSIDVEFAIDNDWTKTYEAFLEKHAKRDEHDAMISAIAAEVMKQLADRGLAYDEAEEVGREIELRAFNDKDKIFNGKRHYTGVII